MNRGLIVKNKALVKVIEPNKKGRSLAPQIEHILMELGEDVTREGLVRTPERTDKSLRFLTSGYSMNLDEIINDALFDVEYDEMVLVRDIEFYSLCEHHMLPFFGKMHVAYLPKDKVIGLSKIPRIVDMYARRLQVQERLTKEVAETLQEVLKPRGVAVVCQARHFCMMMRGVEKQHSGTTTSSMLGAFRTQKETRDEFLSLLSHKRDGF
ncbi:MAG: GTP cyclohydrolase I FolE [Bryobacterales bacterium]|nr:GTP cyclohydrolase I FolE [Bryobacterales bacterium]